MIKELGIIGNCRICKVPVYRDKVVKITDKDFNDKDLLDKVLYHKDLGYACTKHEGVVEYWDDIIYHGKI